MEQEKNQGIPAMSQRDRQDNPQAAEDVDAAQKAEYARVNAQRDARKERDEQQRDSKR